MLINQFKKGDCKHLVTYHNSVSSSKKFGELLKTLLDKDVNITILAIDGTHSMKQRAKIINEFKKSELSILVSAKVLNEGVHISEIDAICFVDPRVSTTDTVQCSCRSLRLDANKTIAKIYVPIIIYDMMNIDENNVFGNLIRILRNLSETDDNIQHYFTAIQNGQLYYKKLIRHDNYLSIEKIGEHINIDEWIFTINVNIWQKVDYWEYNYNELKIWIENNNTLPSKHSTDEIERKLGSFCNNQRQYKKHNKLNEDNIKKLEDINIWYWEYVDPFDESYNELKKWVELNKKIPSTTAIDGIGKKLATFCSTQRHSKKKNKLDKIKGWYWGSEEIKKIRTFDESCNELKK
jgi:predicted transglutaminase-like cysteine proteinase